MGTNYYWIEKPACECCGRDFEAKHIGKSSCGWCFSLHVYPDEGIHDFKDWWARIYRAGSIIKDEYGAVIDPKDLELSIRGRFRERVGLGREELRDAVEGPCGLLRSKIDGRHCIGHGAGTWDLRVGEFS